MHQQAAIGYRENTLEKDNTSTSRRVDDSLRFDTHFFQWYFFQWEKQEQLLEEIFFVPIIMVCLSRWVEILFQLRLGVFAVESIAFEDVVRDSLSQRICSSVFCFFPLCCCIIFVATGNITTSLCLMPDAGTCAYLL